MVSARQKDERTRSEKYREEAIEDHPWLESVSEDRTMWIVRNVGGGAKKSTRIALDIEFEDGTRLPEPENRALFDVAVEYLQLVRLYQPVLGPDIHAGRVSGLVAFFYWLNGRGIRSLAQVKPDHIELFTNDSAFGREWVVRAPHRVLGVVQHRIREGVELPVKDDKRIDLPKLREEARIAWPVVSAWRICGTIGRWLDANHRTIDIEKTADELIAEHGWEPNRQTVQQIHRVLLPMEEVWRWREHFSRPVLRFNPFPEGASAKAKELGSEPKRHPTVPPAVAFPYLRQALRWVTKYGPVIVEGRASGASAAEIEERLAAAGLTIELTDKKQGGNTKKLTLDDAIQLTGGACFAVIAALTARRCGEITALRAGCTGKNSDGGHWMRIYIEKTLQEDDAIPIPVAVHTAVRRMEAISEDARKSTGTDSIWQFRASFGDKVRPLRPHQQLNEIAGYFDTEAGSDWRFTAHQFRRFFAMLYFWRYEKGDLAGLSHHLRHFDLEMTRRYVTDTQFGRIWTEVEQEWRADVVRGVVEGSRAIGGAAGERIKRQIEKMRQGFRKNTEVVTRERIVATLLRRAKRWDAACKIHVWGTICVCPKRSARFGKHAKCKGASETGPIFSQASEETCALCPFAVHTERFKEASEAAHAARSQLASGLSEGALIRKFVESSCEQIERSLSTEATRAPTGD